MQLKPLADLILQVLRAHGPGLVLSVTGWALAYAALGLAVVGATYACSRRREWLATGWAHDAWLRRGILALWVVGVPCLAGTAGGLVGVERTLDRVLTEERLVERVTRRAGVVLVRPIMEVAAGAAEAQAGRDEEGVRVSVERLRALEAEWGERMTAARQQVLDAAGSADTLEGRAVRTAVSLALAAVERLSVEGRVAVARRLLARLEQLRDQDGTVGCGDVAQVVGAEVLEPAAKRALGSQLFWTRAGLHAGSLGLLLLGLLLAWMVRAMMASSGPARIDTPEAVR